MDKLEAFQKLTAYSNDLSTVSYEQVYDLLKNGIRQIPIPLAKVYKGSHIDRVRPNKGKWFPSKVPKVSHWQALQFKRAYRFIEVRVPALTGSDEGSKKERPERISVWANLLFEVLHDNGASFNPFSEFLLNSSIKSPSQRGVFAYFLRKKVGEVSIK